MFSKEALDYAELAYDVSKELESDFEAINVLLLKSHILGAILRENECLEIVNEIENTVSKVTVCYYKF